MKLHNLNILIAAVSYFGLIYYKIINKGKGGIANVASTAGLKGGANMSAYAASKAAVVSLSQPMMAEWRKEIFA
ncbi:SDR family NAD(P)-dependent oxidoreductase [Sphingobacterium pedocola]|uniref:SDR family NAD(P)-dependent oxidoreductase n=1 Tax=Sphingobacterium pedocola TaxID=2082722 RepID=UPI0018C95D7F|nr:SDR family NAD(P)-dependent oxidoreductase [Sphingobacterium pedocola]